MFNKEKFKAGYQDKPDSMREMAGKELYKCGGKVAKYAAGGVAKVRHDQSTMDGKQLNTKKCRNTEVYG